MSTDARLNAARALVGAHLERREVLEQVLLAQWRSPARGLAPVTRLRSFLRISGRLRPVALTSTRVLLLPRGSRGAGGWFDVQYDRRKVSAGRPQRQGSVLVADVLTGLGPQTVRVPAAAGAELEEFCRRLGYRPR